MISNHNSMLKMFSVASRALNAHDRLRPRRVPIEEMRNSLNKLSWKFEEKAVPRYSRSINEPADADENGQQYIPPDQQQISSSFIKAAVVTASLTLALIIIVRNRNRRRASHNGLFLSELEFE